MLSLRVLFFLNHGIINYTLVLIVRSFLFCLKDLGLCFGMSGHPRRATDVRLRLPESSIDVLSVFIGFRKRRVEMVVFDEHMPFM